MEEPQHPTQDETGRFAIDAFLRRYGFRIRSRASGQAVWERGGVMFTQSEVLRRLDWDKYKDAAYLEELYFLGKYGSG